MLLIAMAIMIILSGVTLYFFPAGRFLASNETPPVALTAPDTTVVRVPPRQGQAASAGLAVEWRVLGLDKEGWEAVHNTFTMLWLPVLAVHVWMNRKAILVHLRGCLNEARRFRREAIGALVVTALLTYSVLAGPPPVPWPGLYRPP
jgi:hypothetical protein